MTNMATHPEELLARAADRSPLSAAERRDLDLHLAGCESCRDALDAQRVVVRMLQARDAVAPPAGFSARVSARLDRAREVGGMLDLANWRAWTVGLAPVAAALMLAAYLGLGTTSQSVQQATSSADAVTFETWASSSAETSPAAVFLEPSASADQLLETVLTGSAPSGGNANVR